MTVKLYYFHDPMCSWCWGFAPTWQALEERLERELKEHITIKYILGGLAPDDDRDMPLEMQQRLQGYWHKIEDLLGTRFNYNFWTECKPRRSTYPACRAVLAAGMQDRYKEMNRALQEAYYLQAKNPSDTDTHLQLAEQIGLNHQQFEQDLKSDAVNKELESQIHTYQTLPSKGFPSFVLEKNTTFIPIPVDYNNVELMFNSIKQLTEINTEKCGETL